MTRCTVSGEEPTNPDDADVPNSATRSDGQHVDHWVMCPTEIMGSGFKRPVRTRYVHVGPPGPKYPTRELTPEEQQRYSGEYVAFEPYPESESAKVGRYWTQQQLDSVGKGCQTVTSMPSAIAQTYAVNPSYYGSTFCCGCMRYLPVGEYGEFVWQGTNERVGT